MTRLHNAPLTCGKGVFRHAHMLTAPTGVRSMILASVNVLVGKGMWQCYQWQNGYDGWQCVEMRPNGLHESVWAHYIQTTSCTARAPGRDKHISFSSIILNMTCLSDLVLLCLQRQVEEKV